MQKTWSLKVDVASDREWLNDKWQKEFKKKAEVIVSKIYDRDKIRGNKSLMTTWDYEVNLEVSKALVHVTGN